MSSREVDLNWSGRHASLSQWFFRDAGMHVRRGSSERALSFLPMDANLSFRDVAHVISLFLDVINLIKNDILVSLCYHNKMPQSGWLKQQRFLFSQFWSSRSRYLQCCFLVKTLVPRGWLPPHCVLTWPFFMAALEERSRGTEIFGVSSSFYKGTSLLD